MSDDFTKGMGQGMGFGCGCLLLVVGMFFLALMTALPR
jgi:hypothetical protein